MNKLKIFSCCLLVFVYQQVTAKSVLDSLRMDSSTGKNIVLHKADKGQTLYALLRRYQSTMTEFKELNHGADINLQLGKVYKLAYNKPIKASKVATKQTKTEADVATKAVKPIIESNKSESKKVNTFKVQPGMTLFTVSRKTGVSVANIKKYNRLSSDHIEVGQILFLGEETTEMAAKTTAPSVKVEKPEAIIIVEKPVAVVIEEKPAPKTSEKIVVTKENTTSSAKIITTVEPKVIPKVEPNKEPNTTQKAVIAEKKPAASDINKPIPTIENTEPTGIAKTEEGAAEVIELESKSGKYLALHKTAPLGTLIQVKNETNGASVWVKVIGRLPEIAQNENVVIKLSPKAMSRVSPVDKRFRATVSYTL